MSDSNLARCSRRLSASRPLCGAQVAGILLFLLCGTLKVRGTDALLRQSLTPASTPRGMAPPSQDDDDDDDEYDGQAVLNMDDWISFRCAPELAVQVQVRQALGHTGAGGADRRA